LFIRLACVRQILSVTRDCPELRVAAMMFLASYIFMLRLPSECLPIINSGVGSVDVGAVRQAVVSVGVNSITVTLGRRKNKAHGSCLTRSCWCKQCPLTCPVHVLGAFFCSLPCGAIPFSSFSPSTALATLRRMLLDIGVADARLYRTHDLRRGHARDMQEDGSTLVEILRAGEWRSPAFLQYLDIDQLEGDAAMEAHLNDSSDSD
jgi:hypothetical protein